MEEKLSRERIYTLIEEKAFLKQKVYRNTLQSFSALNDSVKEIYHDLYTKFNQPDKGVFLEYKKHGEFEVRLKIAGDTIVFIKAILFIKPLISAMIIKGYIAELLMCIIFFRIPLNTIE
ncbi:MAG: hypothetical protein NT150_08340 [Bacteroidetes bacterium]|nr:hypothetical protein [Bacteroidota bacterium]